MKKITLAFGLTLVTFVFAACQGNAAAVSTATSAAPISTLLPSATPTITETPTITPTPSVTPLPSSTPGPLPERDTDAEFSTIDRPDDVEGYQIHFIYAIPLDGRDDLMDVDGRIALSAASMNYWLESRTGSRLRYDTFNGELDITFLRFPDDTETIDDVGIDIVDYIEHQIKTTYGFNYDNKIFVVYYDGLHTVYQSYCGIATRPPDTPGQTAVLMLRGWVPYYDFSCPRQLTKSVDYQGFFEMTIVHEILHVLGMVPECAATHRYGHVYDNDHDLMYYAYDGTYSPIYTILDSNNNDYYNHGIPDCPDLADSPFLDPTPEDWVLPPIWDETIVNIPENPLEDD